MIIMQKLFWESLHVVWNCPYTNTHTNLGSSALNAYTYILRRVDKNNLLSNLLIINMD